jgi:hypothetical protein
MGVSKQKNVTILFSTVSRRRCQKNNINVWDKDSVILDLAQSVLYIIVRG